MAHDQATKDRARELRRAGLSVSQIARELGLRSHSMIQRWVNDIAVPEWTRRPRAKDAEREKARAMRLEGSTYDEIAAGLGVSKSSVSLWVRDLARPRRSARDWTARQEGHRRYYEARRRRVSLERQNEKLAWADEVGPLSDREHLIAGAVAYWAEGSKAKPWRPSERVVFVNGDPAMITLFLTFLSMLDVGPGRLRFQVQIHESADAARAVAFWSKIVDAPPESFLKTVLKRHSVLTNRKNTGEGYNGCLSVRVLQSAALYRRIEGVWWAVRA
ncbi:MAG: hypothetical protein ACRDV2_06670, partial [Actinomycetes bacterium]